MIAGLPPAPSACSPLVNPDLAIQQRNSVLRKMLKRASSPQQKNRKRAKPSSELKPALPKFWNSTAPYFTSWVAQELPRVLSPEQLEVGGLTIRSSLNAGWQKQAKKVIANNTWGGQQGALVSLARHRFGARHGGRQRLQQEPVQPRHPSAALAGIHLQAVRLHRCGESGRQARTSSSTRRCVGAAIAPRTSATSISAR